MALSSGDLAQRIRALPAVEYVVADEASGVPQISWGDQFFFVGADRRRPFATIVEHDVPGFDEDSQLDRPGVFRLNIDLGREEFQREFGYAPAQAASHKSEIDFTQPDEVLPHPAYGTHGWACILNPSRRLSEVDRLLGLAHRRATRRDERRTADRKEG